MTLLSETQRLDLTQGLAISSGMDARYKPAYTV